MANRSSIIRKTLVTGAIVAGAGFGAAGLAAAASSSSTSTTPSSSSSSSGSSSTAPQGMYGDPAKMTHGPNETPLTGTDLQKATAAAQAAVPGATVIRAETDSSGAGTYEVHLKKSDGTYATVELGSNFNVLETVSGFGCGPGGGHPGDGTGPGHDGTTPGSTSGTSSSTQA